MFEKFAGETRAVVEDALYEAERRGDRRIASDHLLLALLQNDEIAGWVGTDAATAQAAADQLDRDALAAIGLSVGEVQLSGRAPIGKRAARMTTGAKEVLKRTLVHATAEKSRTITPRHMLLAIIDRRDPDPAATLLAALPVDQTALRERLARAA
ncbi:Clp protease [Leucobacter viscericola]|uniref:Clp protease n=1 Tax=Leucobacter viscericola TaxID=2714935 RepID=A0A6G7XFK8_9MICO|nr:Clp protease N-terminal domain-containing protein [Leucobacter viscericola]QIK63229.1 Clp protease [Leucobacter viscericola]